jgi:hypothetical protein
MLRALLAGLALLAGSVLGGTPASQMSFQVERRVFQGTSTADGGTTSTLSMDEDTTSGLLAQGYTYRGRDPRSGRDFVVRHSAVSIDRLPSGDLDYREYEVGQEDDVTARMRLLRKVELPVATAPGKALTGILSLHPLGWVAPEFEPLRLRVLGMGNKTVSGDRTFISDPKWIWEIVRDPETGLTAEVIQRTAGTNQLMRRTRFEGWKDVGQGRWLPHEVVSQTFRGEEEAPIVELRFRDLEEVWAVRREAP